MTQALQKIFTFDEFIDFLKIQPENIRYELYDGEVVQMPLPIGEHEEIAGFLTIIIGAECVRLKLNYFVPNKTLIKPENKQSGYFTDVLVLNRSNLVNEPRWSKESIITKPESVALVIEVVSTNWRDDYYKKFADYEEMGIDEYWIVDYGAFGSKEFIGNPKQPTFTICILEEGEYRLKKFKGNDRIESRAFPELNLTAEQIFAAQMNG